MIKRYLTYIFILFSLVGIAGLQPAPAFAVSEDPLFSGDKHSPLCTGDAKDSEVCQDKTSKNPFTGEDGVLAKITNIIAFLAGAAAVIVLLVSSIRYITSGGDSGKIGSAKSTIFNAFIGIVVIILARTLIIYVLNRIGK